MDRQTESQEEKDPASVWVFQMLVACPVGHNRLNNREHDLKQQTEVLCMAKSI